MDIKFWETTTYVYVLPILAAFGITTNCISLYVLRRKALRDSAYIYLRTLSTTNLSSLIVTSGLAFVRCGEKCTHYGTVRRYSEKIYEYMVYLPVANFLASYIQLLSMAIAMERFISVKVPLKSKLICTRKTAVRVIWTLGIFASLINVPRFFISQPTIVTIPDKLMIFCVDETQSCSLYTPVSFDDESLSDDDLFDQMNNIFESSLANCTSSVQEECKVKIHHDTRKVFVNFTGSEFNVMPNVESVNSAKGQQFDNKAFGGNHKIYQIFGLGAWRGSRAGDEYDRGTYDISNDFDQQQFDVGWKKRMETSFGRWNNMFWCLVYRSPNCMESDVYLINMSITQPEEVVVKQRMNEKLADDYSVVLSIFFAFPMALSTYFNGALLWLIHQANKKLKELLEPSIPATQLCMFTRAREQHRLTISIVCITITSLIDNIIGIPLYSRVSKLFFGLDYATNVNFRISVLVGNTFTIYQYSTNLFFYAFFNHKFRHELKLIVKLLRIRVHKWFIKMSRPLKDNDNFY